MRHVPGVLDSKARADNSGVEGHFPPLDGLRGIAILLVIVFHSWFRPTLGNLHHSVSFVVGVGWSGVELFFVLSGFLITGILLDARGSDRYFRNFFARRVLRIFPLYYGVLAVYFAVTALPWGWAGHMLGEAAGQQLWYVLFVSNYSMASKGALPQGLDVTWSLAVEEQFYLIWPAVVWLVPQRWLLRLSVTLTLLSFACRVGQIGVGVHPGIIYLLTTSHFGAISLGAAVAVRQRDAGGIHKLVPWAKGLLIAIPLVLFPLGAHAQNAGMYWSIQDPWMVTVGLLLMQLFFAAALVMVLGSRKSLNTTSLLRSRILRAFGRWSYGMYLFHPFVVLGVNSLIHHRAPRGSSWVLPEQLLATATVIGASTALAALSWNLYEKRFLHLKRLFPRRAESRSVTVPDCHGARAPVVVMAVKDLTGKSPNDTPHQKAEPGANRARGEAPPRELTGPL